MKYGESVSAEHQDVFDPRVTELGESYLQVLSFLDRLESNWSRRYSMASSKEDEEALDAEYDRRRSQAWEYLDELNERAHALPPEVLERELSTLSQQGVFAEHVNWRRDRPPMKIEELEFRPHATRGERQEVSQKFTRLTQIYTILFELLKSNQFSGRLEKIIVFDNGTLFDLEKVQSIFSEVLEGTYHYAPSRLTKGKEAEEVLNAALSWQRLKLRNDQDAARVARNTAERTEKNIETIERALLRTDEAI